jgi:heat-inducible transcriptional repressor
MVTQRGLDVLRAIVQDYVSSKEPVGSKSLVERHGFEVSAATIRNDMAALEDEQLIVAPHTSSGRIPTDKGYRVFVDHLAEIRQLSGSQRQGIERFLGESDDFDDLLARTVRTLSQLTNQVAVVQYPSLGPARVQHVELVKLGASRLMSVLITDNGRVEQRIIETQTEISDDDLSVLRNRLNFSVAGKSLTDVESLLANRSQQADSLAAVEVALVAALAEQVQANRQNRLVLAGTANLLKTENDFSGSLYPLLDAIEEQVVVLKLLTEMQLEGDVVNVSIGTEHSATGFEQTSLVSTGYTSAGEVSQVGLIGPTRMDYSGNIAAVQAVARYLTRLLDTTPGA